MSVEQFVSSVVQFIHTQELQLKQQKKPMPPPTTNSRALLMGQRRIVDIIVAQVLRAGGELPADTVQSQLVLQHPELYYSYIGPRPGNWDTFLVRHRDAFSVYVRDLYVHHRPRKQFVIQAWHCTEG